MKPREKWICGVFVSCVLSLVVGTAAAQTSTSTEVKNFEVISVVGNQLVVRGPQGTQEITVPEDFRFVVDGKSMSVHDLKPGMKGTATITTTTTVKPVHVTEIRNGEVIDVTGNAIIVRGDKGFQMFTERDVRNRNVKIMRDGRPVAFTDLRRRDRLTATIISEGAPEILTQKQVDATLAKSAPAATAGTTRPAAPAPSAAAPAPSAPSAPAAPQEAMAAPRRLPKTASPLPLLGLLGGAFLAGGAILTIVRRRFA